MSMDAKARKALAVIQDCVEHGRYLVLPHFVDRMNDRGFFWPDVLAVVESPDDVRPDGRDEYDRPKWIISGKSADGLPVELVCVLDTDDRGHTTVFITLY
jgi:hypothetical protein